jgi:hypothetical protein
MVCCPSGYVPVGCVDTGGTKRAVRIAWHLHQPLTRCNPPAAICSSLEESLVGMHMINGNVFVCLEC